MRTSLGLLEGLREEAEEQAVCLAAGADVKELKVRADVIDNIVKELLTRRVSCRKIDSILAEAGLGPSLGVPVAT